MADSYRCGSVRYEAAIVYTTLADAGRAPTLAVRIFPAALADHDPTRSRPTRPSMTLMYPLFRLRAHCTPENQAATARSRDGHEDNRNKMAHSSKIARIPRLDTRAPSSCGSLRLPPEAALARSVPEIPTEQAMLGGSRYEPKWDGFRSLIVVSDDVEIWSRTGKRLTGSFPELAAAAGVEIPVGCEVDGEAVAWVEGRLSFDVLQQRLGAGSDRARRLASAQPASFVAFDVLAVAGRDVRHLRFDDRRLLLLEHLAAASHPTLATATPGRAGGPANGLRRILPFQK